MISELACHVCSNQFSNQNLPRLLTSCGHTYCQSCIDTMIRQVEGHYLIACPEDGTELTLKSNDIAQFPKNITLINVIEAKKDNSNRSFKNEELQITKIPRKQDSHQDETEQQLITQMQQGEDKAAKTYRLNQKQSVTKLEKESIDRKNAAEDERHPICLVHQKPMDIVCLVDLQKLCAKCAIFGQHRGHQFKSIECIEQQCNSHKEEIVHIYNEKEVIEKRIENDDTRKDILSLLHQQKIKLQKEIADRYRKLIERIRRTQQLSYKRLDDIAIKTEAKIKSIIKTDEKIDREYIEWEQQSFGKILKLQEGTFEQKLQILYGSNNIETVIEKGEQIVQKMVAKQQNIINEVQFIIDGITLDFNQEIYNHIDAFTRITQGQKGYKDLQNQKPAEVSKNGLKNRSPSAPEESLLEEVEQTQKIDQFELQLKIPTDFTSFTSKPEAKVELKNRSTDRVTVEDVVQTKNTSEKFERPPKKKLKSIKVNQKIQKILQALYSDSLQILDLTNSQLGDSIILQICEFLRGTKVKTVKFIRCKLTDDCIPKMTTALSNVVTLYLSQNQLTQGSMQHLIKYRQSMPQLRSLILSQNKIIERKHKLIIQKLRKLDLNVSV